MYKHIGTTALKCFPIHFLPLSPHPTPQSLGLIGICHAVGDKVWPTRGPIILAHCHCPMSQHRHAPSNPPPRFIPPALRSNCEQSSWQALHAQTWESWPNSKPHMGGPGLTSRPGSPEDQLGLLLGAVQQTNLGDSRKGETQTRKDTHKHTYIHTSEIRRGRGRYGEQQRVEEGTGCKSGRRQVGWERPCQETSMLGEVK